MYQPKGYLYDRLDWALIGQPDGSGWIRPRNFIQRADPLSAYHDALLMQYIGRTETAKAWFDYMDDTFDGVTFCCWCPHDRAAQRQMEEHGSFVCHTDVLAEFIETRLGHRVWFDYDRRRMKAL
jgi:hypothetical protein